jgi:hypothetical protein
MMINPIPTRSVSIPGIIVKSAAQPKQTLEGRLKKKEKRHPSKEPASESTPIIEVTIARIIAPVLPAIMSAGEVMNLPALKAKLDP